MGASLLVLVAAVLLLERSEVFPVKDLLAVSLSELAFLLPILILFAWRGWDWHLLGFRRFEAGALALGCGTLILTYSLVILHNLALTALGLPTQAETIGRFLKLAGSPWGLAVGAVFVAPLVEELAFRGFFFQGLRRTYGPTRTILASSAVFSAMHLDPTALIPTFLLGCALAYVFERSRSIWPGALLHMLVNLVGIAAVVLMSRYPGLP